MKQKILYIGFAWLILVLAGCTMDDDRNQSGEGCVQVEVSFRQLPMNPTPRAAEGGDLGDEAGIETLYLFAEQGGVLTPFKFDYGTAGMTSGLVVERINLMAGSYHFYAVANSVKDLSAITTLAALQSEVSDAQPNPTRLIMIGDMGPIDVATEKKVSIRLNRVAARIDIKNEAPDFTFESVSLCNVPDKSNLFFKQAVGKEEGWPALPATATRQDNAEQTVSGNELSGKLYCYESASADASNSAEQVSIIVKGSYLGRMGYYRIDLMDFRGRRWVRRNTRYRMTIQKVTGYGYETLEQAKANKPVNMQLGVHSFVGEETAEVMVYDGEYYLSCSIDELIANHEPTIPWEHPDEPGVTRPPARAPYEFYVKTNAPQADASDPEKWKGSHIPNFPADNTDWVDIRRSPDDLNKVIVNMGMMNDYVYAMVYHITVPGRPNLYLDIPIYQEYLDVFYDEFEVSNSFFRTNGLTDEIFTSNVVLNFNSEWRVKEIITRAGAGWNISTSPGLGQVQRGSGSLTIQTPPLPEGINYGEALIVLELTPQIFSDKPKQRTIRVVSGLTIDYDIEYPLDMPYFADLSRTKHVIETPLNQTATHRFKVNVRSTQHWRVEAHQSWITVIQPEFSGGSYNTHFYVDVPVNPGTPVISGMKKAREGKVRILGGQTSLDIMVYQGGYVQIGNDIWMDRNLKRSRYNETFVYYNHSSRNLYGRETSATGADSYRAKLIESGTLDELLYPAAVPWAFPAEMTACYNKHRDATFNQQRAGGRLLIPNLGCINGEYYYLQFGYNQTNKVQLPPNNDGYFTWGQPMPIRVGDYTSSGGYLLTSWNSRFNLNDPITGYSTQKTKTDPCPAGWRVPTYAELNGLLTHLASANHYSSGIKDLALPKHHDDMNNGLYFYNNDKVSCWFPFTGHRYRYSTHRWQGKKTGYCMNGAVNSYNTFNLTFGYNINDKTGEIPNDRQLVAMIIDASYNSYPIRCIRDI